ncbi:MAG: lipopolysaccharide assembly protein LapA domain-containing protein [Moraxellaceae bacterium]|jgi:uncharacterized integral membrane protein|nr:lipopolysaccharide assembly protein LapA domain-containing protein [Moraxellaceae bacterium]
MSYLRKTLMIVFLLFILFVVLWMSLANSQRIDLDLLFVSFINVHAGLTIFFTFVIGIFLGFIYGVSWLALRQRRVEKAKVDPNVKNSV